MIRTGINVSIAEINQFLRDDRYTEQYIVAIENGHTGDYTIMEYGYKKGLQLFSHERKRGYIYSNSYVMMPNSKDEITLSKKNRDKLISFRREKKSVNVRVENGCVRSVHDYSKGINKSIYIVEAKAWKYCVPLTLERKDERIDIFSIGKTYESVYKEGNNEDNFFYTYRGRGQYENVCDKTMKFVSWSDTLFPVCVNTRIEHKPFEYTKQKKVDQYVIVSDTYEKWACFIENKKEDNKGYSMLTNGKLFRYSSENVKKIECQKYDDIGYEIIIDTDDFDNEGVFLELKKGINGFGSLERVINITA